MLSVVGGVAAGLFDVDLPLDIRDFAYDVTHTGQLEHPVASILLDGVAFLPLIGALKYADDVADVAKHADDVADVAKQVDKAADTLDGIKDTRKAAENFEEIVGINKYGRDVTRATGNLDDLPQSVQDSFKAYDKAGWKGKHSGQLPDTHAGGTWRNKDAYLPSTDAKGNAITYREFDVNECITPPRDGERFIFGSDGSVWYTDSHYGQSTNAKGIADFIKIK